MADTGKKYIPEGVFLVCDKGSIPTQLICDPHPINLYGVRYADENDNKPQLNILSFGKCKTLPAPACVPPPGLLWTKVKQNVRLHGSHPLLEDSTCLCSVGGTITIFFDEYDASLAAENNSESGFVREPVSSMVLGMMGSGIFGMISPEFRDGVGRGLKKGLEGTYNFFRHDLWKAETWVGMGKLAVIAAAYSSPHAALTGDITLRSLDNLFGTDFRTTKDAVVTGVERTATHAVENLRRGNWAEVGEDVGQVEYAVIEAVVGSKGVGLAAKGAKTGLQGLSTAAKAVVGAERVAQIAEQSLEVMQRIKRAVGGIVKVGKGAARSAISPLIRSGGLPGEQLITEEGVRLVETTGMGPGGAPGGEVGVPHDGLHPHVPQAKENWCGAACGEMAARRLGVGITQDQLAATKYFEPKLVFKGQVVSGGGFQSSALANALEEVAPVGGRSWIGGTDVAHDFQSAEGLRTTMQGYLQSTESSVILRVRGADHWIVIDEVTADGLIVVRDPALGGARALTGEELLEMRPTGDLVISTLKGGR